MLEHGRREDGGPWVNDATDGRNCVTWNHKKGNTAQGLRGALQGYGHRVETSKINKKRARKPEVRSRAALAHLTKELSPASKVTTRASTASTSPSYNPRDVLTTLCL